MEVGVTPGAADYITQRGGRLYLWEEAVGVDWSADHTAFEDPSAGMTFTAVWVAGVAVMLADDLERPMKLRIRLDRLPRRRLYIDWDGARWGWRGDAVGAS